MGSLPSWWNTYVAAKQLGVAPWELEAAPAFWTARALAAREAEAHARNPTGW